MVLGSNVATAYACQLCRAVRRMAKVSPLKQLSRSRHFWRLQLQRRFRVSVSLGWERACVFRERTAICMNSVQSRLDTIITEFSDLDGREKLELLLDFANGLPPLSAEYQARKATEDRRVHECQTSVFLWTELEHDSLTLIAEVAPEAPTVKGFVAIVAHAIAGQSAMDALSLPDNILERMGLAEVLGILRTRGLRAIVSHVKRGIVQKLAAVEISTQNPTQTLES